MHPWSPPTQTSIQEAPGLLLFFLPPQMRRVRTIFPHPIILYLF